MARRSRENRTATLGYDEHRPNRDDRRQDHRRTRHAANQMLHTAADPEELEPLPYVKRTREHEPIGTTEVQSRRFRVWKTKFWKRRDGYRDMKAQMDARWEEVSAKDDEDDW
jgi:hypothetical protein